VDPLHVVPQLLQILDVAVADLADDEPALALAGRLAGFHARHGLLRRRLRPGTDVIIFKNIIAEKFGEKIGVFDSKQSLIRQNFDHNIIFLLKTKLKTNLNYAKF
jgi:hypothetical protein